MYHSVDFHGATGPGGGAEFTQAAPGEEKIVTFKALVPGPVVYHCATPSVPHHITSGMYGTDRWWNRRAGCRRWTANSMSCKASSTRRSPFGTQGHQELDYGKLMTERPEYFVFNGAVSALTRRIRYARSTGETVRIFFGVGGPNFTSSFHVIGAIFDRAYEGASLRGAAVAGRADRDSSHREVRA